MIELIGWLASAVGFVLAFLLGVLCILAPFAIPAFLIYRLIKRTSRPKHTSNSNPYDRGTIKY